LPFWHVIEWPLRGDGVVSAATYRCHETSPIFLAADYGAKRRRAHAEGVDGEERRRVSVWRARACGARPRASRACARGARPPDRRNDIIIFLGGRAWWLRRRYSRALERAAVRAVAKSWPQHRRLAEEEGAPVAMVEGKPLSDCKGAAAGGDRRRPALLRRDTPDAGHEVTEQRQASDNGRVRRVYFQRKP
jgi:hypothetical protein